MVKRIGPQVGRYSLQGDGALQTDVASPVNFAHRAFAESLADLKTPTDSTGERTGRVFPDGVRSFFGHGEDGRPLASWGRYLLPLLPAKCRYTVVCCSKSYPCHSFTANNMLA